MTGRPWLVPWHPSPRRRPTLLCLPEAGSGCGQFRAWQSRTGPEVSVVGVAPPGREARWSDPWPSTMEDAVRQITAELVELVDPDGLAALVVFGQSFGGLLGYEVTRRLGDLYGRWPVALVIAACRPPHMWVGAARGLVDDGVEAAQLLDARGLSSDDLDEDSRQVVLEVLRNDARLSLTYVATGGAPLCCPVEAWRGQHDEIVTVEHLDGWRDYTTGGFSRRRFSGGHYFWVDQADALADALRELAVGNASDGM